MTSQASLILRARSRGIFAHGFADVLRDTILAFPVGRFVAEVAEGAGHGVVKRLTRV